MKEAPTRRSFLALLAASLPAAAALPRNAWASVASTSSDQDAGTSTGPWNVLEHVTDGTNPSTAVIAEPHFNPHIQHLAGTEITLSGFIQPVSRGFGASKDYLLSRTPFHCPYCYASGRGSLALVTLNEHVPAMTGKRVSVRGTLALQTKDPADFYFQLKNAKIVA